MSACTCVIFTVDSLACAGDVLVIMLLVTTLHWATYCDIKAKLCVNLSMYLFVRYLYFFLYIFVCLLV